MNSLEQLEKQQIGLRLPKYLVDDIDEFTKEFSLNRTDIIVEAIRSYIERQKELNVKVYSNHSANLIKDWKDKQEDEIWK